MRVRVVVEVDLPGEGGGRQVAVLGIGAGARVGERLAPGVERPVAGAVMVAVGGLLGTTVSVALLLVALPKSFVTTARNVAPLSDSWVGSSV